MIKLILLVIIFTPATIFSKTLDLKLFESNTVWLDDVVTEKSVDKAMTELIAKCDGRDLYLVLNTPGGYIDEGNRLTRYMEASKCRINTVVLKAASMGHIIAQYGKIRYIHVNGRLMQHTPGTMLIGSYTLTDLREIVKALEDVNKQILNPIAPRMKKTLDALLKYIGKERWWIGREAVLAYMADQVVTINGL